MRLQIARVVILPLFIIYLSGVPDGTRGFRPVAGGNIRTNNTPETLNPYPSIGAIPLAPGFVQAPAAPGEWTFNINQLKTWPVH